MHEVSASFSCFAFISPKFAQTLKYVAQSCDCMIVAFSNSAIMAVNAYKWLKLMQLAVEGNLQPFQIFQKPWQEQSQFRVGAKSNPGRSKLNPQHE